MNLGSVRAVVMRRGTLLALAVLGLAVVAALLAVSVLAQARDLATGSSQSPSAVPSPTASVTPEPATPEPTVEVTPEPSPEPTPQPTPIPTPEGITGWDLTATFGRETTPTGVLDLDLWNDTVVAVGTSWRSSTPDARLWTSPDGRSWTEAPLDLGPDSSLQEVAVLPDGRLLILGTIGDDIAYWSDQARAAGWVSTDALSWTPVEVPFSAGSHYGPIQFAAGGRGLVAVNAGEIWHSTDGESWTLSYDAPRGTAAYEPVAGDEGFIVKRSNASLGTTTLLVSGDAVTWHEVDLGNIASVDNVAGDWLATRVSDDWLRSEVLRSANGLDWTVIVDLSELPPPEGTEVTASGARLTGTGEVLLMSPWQWGHCGAMPSNGWGAWWSVDGIGWVSAGIGPNTVVTHAVQLGDHTVLAGYTSGAGEIGFWISTP